MINFSEQLISYILTTPRDPISLHILSSLSSLKLIYKDREFNFKTLSSYYLSATLASTSDNFITDILKEHLTF